jgi:hypothetical protein
MADPTVFSQLQDVTVDFIMFEIPKVQMKSLEIMTSFSKVRRFGALGW